MPPQTRINFFSLLTDLLTNLTLVPQSTPGGLAAFSNKNPQKNKRVRKDGHAHMLTASLKELRASQSQQNFRQRLSEHVRNTRISRASGGAGTSGTVTAWPRSPGDRVPQAPDLTELRVTDPLYESARVAIASPTVWAASTTDIYSHSSGG